MELASPALPVGLLPVLARTFTPAGSDQGGDKRLHSRCVERKRGGQYLTHLGDFVGCFDWQVWLSFFRPRRFLNLAERPGNRSLASSRSTRQAEANCALELRADVVSHPARRLGSSLGKAARDLSNTWVAE